MAATQDGQNLALTQLVPNHISSFSDGKQYKDEQA